MLVLGTKIKQETVNYCKKGKGCEECRCNEKECIEALYYVLHADEDV